MATWTQLSFRHGRTRHPDGIGRGGVQARVQGVAVEPHLVDEAPGPDRPARDQDAARLIPPDPQGEGHLRVQGVQTGVAGDLDPAVPGLAGQGHGPGETPVGPARDRIDAAQVGDAAPSRSVLHHDRAGAIVQPQIQDQPPRQIPAVRDGRPEVAPGALTSPAGAPTSIVGTVASTGPPPPASRPRPGLNPAPSVAGASIVGMPPAPPWIGQRRRPAGSIGGGIGRRPPIEIGVGRDTPANHPHRHRGRQTSRQM